MLDVRAQSIIYQSQVKIAELADTLVSKKRLGKPKDETWEKILLIRRYLKALEYKDYLTDITDANYILECLIKLTCINEFPAAPVLNYQTMPAILTGIPGAKGDKGDTGPAGATGMATDFQVGAVSLPTTIDSFAIGSATGARWDYTIIKNTGEQRTGTVMASWKADGSAVTYTDTSTSDIGGSTASFDFIVEFLSPSTIRLLANTVTSSWTVVGSRYFIPTNGNGSGPVSDVLADGKIYIGSVANFATAQTMSGVIQITRLGVTSFVGTPVTNAVIQAAAGISLNKLQALTGPFVAATDNSGFLTVTTVTPTVLQTKLAYVDTGASINTLIAAKMTNPMTTLGDIIYGGSAGTPTRLGIGTNGYILSISGGLPAWTPPPGGISGLTTTYLPIATGATSIGNSTINLAGNVYEFGNTKQIHANGGIASYNAYLQQRQVVLGVNLFTSGDYSYPHGLGSNYTKIRDVRVVIKDNFGNMFPLEYDGSSYVIDSTNITLLFSLGTMPFAGNVNFSAAIITLLITYDNT